MKTRVTAVWLAGLWSAPDLHWIVGNATLLHEGLEDGPLGQPGGGHLGDLCRRVLTAGQMYGRSL